jgi:hypothetical protein
VKFNSRGQRPRIREQQEHNADPRRVGVSFWSAALRRRIGFVFFEILNFQSQMPQPAWQSAITSIAAGLICSLEGAVFNRQSAIANPLSAAA